MSAHITSPHIDKQHVWYDQSKQRSSLLKSGLLLLSLRWVGTFNIEDEDVSFWTGWQPYTFGSLLLADVLGI